MANPTVPYTIGTTAATRLTTQEMLLSGIDSQRLFGFDGVIKELCPDQAPYLTILNKLARVSVNDPDQKYTEYRASFITRPACWLGTAMTLTSAAAGTIFDDIVLYDGASSSSNTTVIKAGQIIQLVGQSSSADVVTQTASFYVKGTGTSGAGYWKLVLLTNAPGNIAVANSGATRSKFYVVSSAYGEGSAASIAKYEADITRWASTELMKERFTISEDAAKLFLPGQNDELAKQQMRALKRHKAGMERKFLYGGYRIGATAGDPYSAPVTATGTTSAGGAVYDADGNRISTTTSMLQAAKTCAAITGETRVFGLSSASTFKDIITNMENQFRWGSATKYAFVGAGMLTVLNNLLLDGTLSPLNRVNMQAGQDQYGINITKLMTPHGDLNLVLDRTMSQDGIYNRSMFVVDPANVELMVYRDTQLYELPTSADVKDYEFRSNIGLKVLLPETHGFWYYA